MSAPRIALPRGFAEELRRENPSLVTEIVREIRRQIPEYDRPIDSLFISGLIIGVQTALAEFADTVDGHGVPPGQRARVYRGLGRSELAEGRSMDAMQSACRLGGRLAWRRYARVARRVGMRPEQMVDLAEAVFAHVDQIATASVLGYAQAKSDIGEAQERRRRLLAAVLSRAPRDSLAAAAEEADWPLPELVACVALGPAPGWREAADPPPQPSAAAASVPRFTPRLPEEILADLASSTPYLLIPEPEAWLAKPELRDFLRDRRAVIGPTVPLQAAADSLRWARLARERLATPPPSPPSLPSPPQAGDPTESALDVSPLHCDARLPLLLFLGDEPLLRLIADRRLSPLGALTVKQRERIEATLLAWLDTSRGTAPEVAARLGIHPQTARSRIHRMQQLLGAALSTPESRFELELALRGRRLLAEFGRAA